MSALNNGQACGGSPSSSWHVARYVEKPMQMDKNDVGWSRSVIVVCLLVLALAMIALSVSVQRDFAPAAQLVDDALKPVTGNI